MSEHGEHKKAKKLAQLLKNRKIQNIQKQQESLYRERDLEKEREEEVKEAHRSASKRGGKSDEPVWSARMQEVRNKIDGRKRMADERWNRFAGTEGGGGRGL